MTCERVEEHLSALIDNELESRTSSEINEHLAHCAACRSTYEQLKLIVAESARLEMAAPPDRLYWVIRQRARQPERTPWFSPKRIGWIAVPALATFALMLVLFPRERPVTSGTRDPGPRTRAEAPVVTTPELEVTREVPPVAEAPSSRSRSEVRTLASGSTRSEKPIRAAVAVIPAGQVPNQSSGQGFVTAAPSNPPDEAIASLRNIQQALEEIEAALRQNPGNPQVQIAYRVTYQKGLELKDRYLLGAR